MAKKNEPLEKHRGHGEGSWEYHESIDKWRFRTSVQTLDGTIKRVSVTAATKGECRELAKLKSEQVVKGIGLNLDTKNITVKEYLSRWFTDYVDPCKKTSTRRVYNSVIKNQLTETIGEIALKKLQRPAIQRHFNQLAESGLSTATMDLVRTVLRAALKQACEDRIIEHNPSVGIKLAPVENKKRIAYSVAEVQSVLKLVADNRYRIGFHLLFGLALREGEMLGLKWNNVNIEKGRVQIVEQLSRHKAATFDSPKSKASIRTLPLSAELVAELKSWRIKQKEILLKAGITWTEEMTVLSNEIGLPISHEVFLVDYYKTVKAAGLNTTGCHDARHSRLTQLALTGIDARTLTNFAGHSDVAFTLKVYVSPSQEAAAAAVNQIDKAIYQAK